MSEAGIKFREELYIELVEQASDMIQCLDGNGRFLYVIHARHC